MRIQSRAHASAQALTCTREENDVDIPREKRSRSDNCTSRPPDDIFGVADVWRPLYAHSHRHATSQTRLSSLFFLLISSHFFLELRVNAQLSLRDRQKKLTSVILEASIIMFIFLPLRKYQKENYSRDVRKFQNEKTNVTTSV